MKRRRAPLLLAALALAGASAPAAAPPIGLAEAARHLRIDADAAQATAASWNGEKVLFVDLLEGPQDDTERQVFVLRRAAGGALQSARVVTAGQEGADAELAAIGFANADRDPAKEAILILQWPVNHYDVGGDLYEVRLLDDWKAGQTRLAPLTALSRHFGIGCDCAWRDGRRKPFRFKTIAAVRRELAGLGY